MEARIPQSDQAQALGRTARARMALGRTAQRLRKTTGLGRAASVRMVPGRAMVRRLGRAMVRGNRTTAFGWAEQRGRAGRRQNGAGQSNGASAGQNSGAGQQNNGSSTGQSNGSGQSDVSQNGAAQSNGASAGQNSGAGQQNNGSSTGQSNGSGQSDVSQNGAAQNDSALAGQGNGATQSNGAASGQNSGSGQSGVGRDGAGQSNGATQSNGAASAQNSGSGQSGVGRDGAGQNNSVSNAQQSAQGNDGSRPPGARPVTAGTDSRGVGAGGTQGLATPHTDTRSVPAGTQNSSNKSAGEPGTTKAASVSATEGPQRDTSGRSHRRARLVTGPARAKQSRPTNHQYIPLPVRGLHRRIQMTRRGGLRTRPGRRT